MNYQELIEKIVEKGIKAAKRDYTQKDQKSILKGSIAGFKACLGKTITELSDLLEKAQKDSYLGDHKNIDEHWYKRGYSLEIEWVCNVVSVVLYNEGLPVIINPTARGAITASDIVGVNSLP